jgi:hypothetical protein
MRVSPYIRKVLEIYAGGDEGHLATTLFRDVGPEPSPWEEKLHALINHTEELNMLIAQLLAGGRMLPDAGDPQMEQSLVAQVEKNVKSVGELWAEIPSLEVSIPSKSDLIEIGILHFVLERLESGIDRISSLDVLSHCCPAIS